jgi:hypothetical protein
MYRPEAASPSAGFRIVCKRVAAGAAASSALFDPSGLFPGSFGRDD